MQAVTIDREKYIGGSDIPIIMGISPFKTRFDLLLEKAGLKENDFTGNEYTEYGNIMEPKIRNYMCEIDHTEYKEDKLIKDDVRCHVDGYDGAVIIEIKTTSQVHKNLDEYKVYLVQLLFYMYHYNKELGQLCVYERPDDFNEKFDKKRLQVFDVELDNYKELIEQINRAVDQFRIDLVKVKENPFITEEELLPVDLARLSSEVVILETELAKMKEIEDRYKAAKEELKVGMERVGLNKWETPNGTKITLVEDSPDKEVEIESYDEEKFIKENPELHEQYNLKLAEYKITKKEIKKGKKGYVRITFPKER